MTAPPRLPMRSAYRNRAKRPPPRLNLHLLDSPETTDPPIRETTPPLAQLAEKTPRRRARNIQQRLVSFLLFYMYIYFADIKRFLCRRIVNKCHTRLIHCDSVFTLCSGS